MTGGFFDTLKRLSHAKEKATRRPPRNERQIQWQVVTAPAELALMASASAS